MFLPLTTCSDKMSPYNEALSEKGPQHTLSLLLDDLRVFFSVLILKKTSEYRLANKSLCTKASPYWGTSACSTEHTPRLNPSKGQGCFLQCYCVLSRWISQNLHWATESFQPLPILFESLQVTHLSEVSGCTQWSLCSAGWQGEGFLLHPPVRSHHYRLQHHHLLHATTFASLDSDLEESLSPLLLVSDDGFGS